MLTKGHSDTFVESCLLSLKDGSITKKTAVVKNNLNPFWTEEFIYKKVPLDEVEYFDLTITVWDHHLLARNKIRGLLHLDLYPSGHWPEMLKHQGQWVERWHDLRSDFIPSSKWSKHRPIFWSRRRLSPPSPLPSLPSPPSLSSLLSPPSSLSLPSLSYMSSSTTPTLSTKHVHLHVSHQTRCIK